MAVKGIVMGGVMSRGMDGTGGNKMEWNHLSTHKSAPENCCVWSSALKVTLDSRCTGRASAGLISTSVHKGS